MAEQAKTQQEIKEAATVTPESAKFKPNTSKSVQKAKVSDSDLNKEIARAKAAFSKEKMVKVAIPQVFQKDFGHTLYVGVNGVFINIPVDGKEYEVPETLAAHAKEAMNNLK